VASGELKTSNELAADRTDMALSRTLTAADRTLMVWIRTRLSMLSFGFTIYKFLLYVKESLWKRIMKAEGPAPVWHSANWLSVHVVHSHRPLQSVLTDRQRRRPQPVEFCGPINRPLRLIGHTSHQRDDL
jgi:hypothetical protein